MRRRQYKLFGTSLGCGGILLVTLAVIAVVVALLALCFLLLWNDFVVGHVAGTTATTFWGAIGPAVLVSALCGSRSVSASRR